MDDNLDTSNPAHVAPVNFSEPQESDGGTRAEALRAQAARCRRLSSTALDPRTLESLNAMASEYEEEAERLGRTG